MFQRIYRATPVHWDGFNWCRGLMGGGKSHSACRTNAYYLKVAVAPMIVALNIAH